MFAFGRSLVNRAISFVLPLPLVLGLACGGGGKSEAPPVISSFNCAPSRVLIGQSAALSWQVAGADSIAIDNNVGIVNGTSVDVTPSGPTTYTLTAKNAAGSRIATATVTVAVSADGGTISDGQVTITVPPSTAIGQVDFHMARIPTPDGLPVGVKTVGKAVEIGVAAGQEGNLNAPVQITVPYDSSVVANTDKLAVLHYNAARGSYEPVTMLAQDDVNHTVTFDTRIFSPFQVVDTSAVQMPSSYLVPNFTPIQNGWQIQNFGSYFSYGGNCLGMSAYATWFFRNRPSETLFGKYSAGSTTATKVDKASIAAILVQRAMLAQSQYWAGISNNMVTNLGSAQIANQMKSALINRGEPAILLLYGVDKNTGDKIGHASVLYGFDVNGFIFYDVNFPGEVQTISWDGFKFGHYNKPGYSFDFNSFSYLAMPSLGRTEDFAALTVEAESGFKLSGMLHVSTPVQDDQVIVSPTNWHVNLSGTVDIADATSLLVFSKAGMPPISIQNGVFSAEIPIFPGENTITLLTGSKIDNSGQSGWYPNSACYILSIHGLTPPNSLKFETNPASYFVGATIPPNNPSFRGGAPSAFSVNPALPSGLVLDPTLGIITGTPTTASAQATYTVTATNSAGSSTCDLLISVTQLLQAPTTLAYGSNPATYTVGTVIPPNIPTFNGGTPTAFSVSPALPQGLALDPVSGIITGTPTITAIQGSCVITASNSAGSTQCSLMITVNSEPVVAEVASIPNEVTLEDVSYLGNRGIFQIRASSDTILDGTTFDTGSGFYEYSNNHWSPVIISTNKTQYANSVWSPIFIGSTIFFISNSTPLSPIDYWYICSLQGALPDTGNSVYSDDASKILALWLVPGGQGLRIHKSASGNMLTGVSWSGSNPTYVVFSSVGIPSTASFQNNLALDGVLDDLSVPNRWIYPLDDGSIMAWDSVNGNKLLFKESLPVSNLSIAGDFLSYICNGTGVLLKMTSLAKVETPNVEIQKIENANGDIIYTYAVADGNNVSHIFKKIIN